MLLVADKNKTFLISGTGDVIEPADDALAIVRAAPMPTPRRSRTWTRGPCRRRR
jgi:hypothetical protein